MLSSRVSNGGASSNGGTTLTNGTAGQKSAQAAAAFSTHDGTNMGDRRGLLLGLNGSDYVRLLVCSGCGFVFGIAAEKARGRPLTGCVEALHVQPAWPCARCNNSHFRHKLTSI